MSFFSSCTFLHTHIPNMTPWMDSMVHNISIDYSYVQNKLLSKVLFPMEVNWCQHSILTVSTVTFSYRLYFVPRVARWKFIFKLFKLIYRDKAYLGTHPILAKLDRLKMLFRVSKSPCKFKTFKNMKIS
jgi:hypothetical protein